MSHRRCRKMLRTHPSFGLLFALLLLASRPICSCAQAHGDATGARSLVCGDPEAMPITCQQLHGIGQPSVPILQGASDPTTAADFNTLGTRYVREGRYECAIAAFKASLKLDPSPWETHNNLALAYAADDAFDQAAAEFRAALRKKPDSYLAHNGLGLALERIGQLETATEEFKKATEIDPNFFYGTLNLVEVSLELKRYAAVEYYIQKSLLLSPPQSIAQRMRMDLGVAYSESGKYSKASDVFSKLIEETPGSAQVHFNFATSLAHQLQFAQAAEQFKLAMELDPSNAEAQLAMMNAMLLTERVNDAVPYALQYVKNHPNDAAGFTVLGQIYRKLGQDRDAVQPLQRAIQLNPKDYDARYNLGLVLSHLGSPKEAIDQLKVAKSLKPDSEEAAYSLAMLLARSKDATGAHENLEFVEKFKTDKDNKERAGILNNQGNADLQARDFVKASDAYKQAVNLDPTNAQWRFNHALALSSLGELQAEESELAKALQLDPTSAEAHNQLGLCFQSENQSAAAEEQFKKALELNPAYAEAENNLGVLYAKAKKNAIAIQMFQRAILFDPQYTQAFLNLGVVFTDEGNLYEASVQFQKAIEVSPDLPDAYSALAEVRVKEGHVDQAIPLFQKGVSLEPDSASAHLNLGVALADSWDVETALQQFTKAEELDPKSVDAHYHKGSVLAKLDRLDEARQELELTCQLAPNSPSAAFTLALVDRKQGDLGHSTLLLQKVVLLSPNYPKAQSTLARNLSDLGRPLEAVEHWRLALKVDPSDPDALYRLGQALAKSNPSESEMYLNRVNDLQKSDQLIDRIKTLGNVGIKAASTQDWGKAVSAYDEAIRLCGECQLSGALHKNLGLIYGRKGETQKAQLELREALKLNPKDPDVLQAIDALSRPAH